MFEGWQRADIISAFSLLVSALAFGVSLAAARFTFAQTRIARRKEAAEIAGLEPEIQTELAAHEHRPDWYRLSLFVRNRRDIAIVCGELKVLAPRGAKIVVFDLVDWQFDQMAGGQPSPPDKAALSAEVDLDMSLQRVGSSGDSRHFPGLVVLPASSSRPSRLRMSLKVRCSNASDSFAEIIVVTKIPTVRTSRDA